MVERNLKTGSEIKTRLVQNWGGRAVTNTFEKERIDARERRILEQIAKAAHRPDPLILPFETDITGLLLPVPVVIARHKADSVGIDEYEEVHDGVWAIGKRNGQIPRTEDITKLVNKPDIDGENPEKRLRELFADSQGSLLYSVSARGRNSHVLLHTLIVGEIQPLTEEAVSIIGSKKNVTGGFDIEDAFTTGLVELNKPGPIYYRRIYEFRDGSAQIRDISMSIIKPGEVSLDGLRALSHGFSPRREVEITMGL